MKEEESSTTSTKTMRTEDTPGDASSVVSELPSKSPWSKPYVPPPVVDQSTVLAIGFFIFALAMIWPPLILLFTYVASKLLPYSFRVNDDPTKRRILFTEFAKDEDLPEDFRETPEEIHLEEGYRENARYVQSSACYCRCCLGGRVVST